MSKIYTKPLAPPTFAYHRMWLLAFLLLAWMPSVAQFTVTCPSNRVVFSDSAACGSAQTYSVSISGGTPIVTTFNFTGSMQDWVVPSGVGQVTIDAWGAQGNSNAQGVVGGLGGKASGSLAVNPGDTLHIFVGGGGAAGTTGGYNGGGNAGAVGAPSAFGGGGGGGSDVRVGGTGFANRVIVGGGGGGAAGNRVATLGRGTGGGGGGGYFGGGGGAGWPSSSLVVPIGGTQSAGGAGGTSTYTSAPNNNGLAGVLGIGGKGGDEVTSNQSASQVATTGGTGGGTTGANGTYAGNFAGQSGAGGSGYIGGVTGGTMLSGNRTGAGLVQITYFVPDSVVQLAGLPSTSFFPVGTTTNVIAAYSGVSGDSCSFTITVVDHTPPAMTCPGMDTLLLDSGCVAVLPDYQGAVNASDNCTSVVIEIQSPAAGSFLSGVGSLQPISYTAIDSAGNSDTCNFMVWLWDVTPPTSGNCPQVPVEVTPTTMDCNPAVTFSAPSFTDNCGAAPIDSSNYVPGDHFPIGTTTVTYYTSDSAGNIGICSFDVIVNTPSVSVITVTPPFPCDSSTAVLSVPANFTTVWSTSAISQSITVGTPGIYWVDVTDTTGCTARDSVTITFSSPSPVVTANGAQVCASGFATYQWMLNGSPISGATSACFQPTTNGSYSVMVTDSNGCTGLSAPLIFTAVNDGFDAGFDMYPNPAQSQLNIRMLQPINEACQIKVYDLSGRVVISRAYNELQGTTTLDLGNLSAGSYIVEVSSSTLRGQRRLTHLQ
jgi:hypothetical protein